MKKKVLVAWSGGIDSTALICKYLQSDYKVDAIYTNLLNNELKIKSELEAINKIIPILEK